MPAIFSLVVFPLVGMVDTFFVGRMGDAISLAGMGAANAAYSAVFFVLAVVSVVVRYLLCVCRGVVPDAIVDALAGALGNAKVRDEGTLPTSVGRSAPCRPFW